MWCSPHIWMDTEVFLKGSVPTTVFNLNNYKTEIYIYIYSLGLLWWEGPRVSAQAHAKALGNPEESAMHPLLRIRLRSRAPGQPFH